MQESEKVSSSKREKFKKAKTKRLYKRSGAIKAKMWVGKDGITSTLVEQLNNQLKIDELVKIKIQKNFLEDCDIEKVAQKVADYTNSHLIDVRGRTFSLYK